MLEDQRIAGERALWPDDTVKAAMTQANQTKLQARLKVCLDVAGGIESVNVTKPSGLTAYDEHLLRGVQKWRYRPYVLNGKAVPVCFIAVFVYKA